ncbi:MAG: hypothetical protein JW770_03065, partial [Actinobacteria bacterium]|nr:hypothetical protein [Actinomycetota bacterium]
YFIFSHEVFLSVTISSLIAFLIFFSTLVFYRWVRLKNPVKLLQFVFISLIAKMAFLGLAFYLIFRSGILDMTSFTISFLIFFTLFLNMEVFFIYRKILFK